MKAGKGSKSSLFLIEMILVILFFSITSAVCIGLFTKAHQTAKHSVELTHAVLLCESAAEEFKVNDGVEKGYTTGYDRDWQVTTAAPEYVMQVDIQAKDNLITAEIEMHSGDREIYRLEAKTLGNGGEGYE